MQNFFFFFGGGGGGGGGGKRCIMVYVKMVNNSFKRLACTVRFTDCLLLLPTCLFLG